MSTLAARIIHDIVNPLGAVANGLELLELSGFPKTEEFKLLEDSVHHANAKIRTLRLAFGPIKSDAPIPTHQLTDVISSIFPTGRYDVTLTLPDAISPRSARLMTLFCLCIADAIPFGGTISLAADYVEFKSSKHLNLEDFEALIDGRLQITAPKIHYAFIKEMFDQCDTNLTLTPLRDGARLDIPQQLINAEAA